MSETQTPKQVQEVPSDAMVLLPQVCGALYSSLTLKITAPATFALQIVWCRKVKQRFPHSAPILLALSIFDVHNAAFGKKGEDRQVDLVCDGVHQKLAHDLLLSDYDHQWKLSMNFASCSGLSPLCCF